MQIAKYLVAAGLTVLWASCAWAGIYTAPLDGLKGVYSSDGGDLGPFSKRVAFDFGRSFARIDGVWIAAKGTVAPGLWGVHSVLGAFPDTKSEVYPALDFFVHPAQDFTIGGTAGLNEDGAFDTEIALTGFRTPDWAFLSSGRGDVDLYIVGANFFGDTVGTQIVPCIAAITEARLVIDGQAVPEPAGASVVIMSLSIAAVWRARRN